MLSFFPDRSGGCREGWIGEHTDGNSDDSGCCRSCVEDGHAAIGTEVEDGFLTSVRDADVLSKSALGRDLLGVESGLDTERAAGSTLAGQAVTDRDANRLSLGTEPKLLTAASRLANGHSLIVEIGDQLRAPAAPASPTTSPRGHSPTLARGRAWGRIRRVTKEPIRRYASSPGTPRMA